MSSIHASSELPILECVANFSEGRNHETLRNIAESIKSVVGVKLLHLDVGFDANRTVMTFAGEPAALVEAAFQAIRTAAEKIDMRTHHGVHPRIGATDVCPLIPISGITMAEAVDWSIHLGRRVGEELGIPVYLYESSAKHSYRNNLATIRIGEYEGLAKKMQDPDWQPDFGPSTFQPLVGATVIGARKFLIAYNVNLATADIAIAKRIAERVRESGYFQITDDGQKRRIPGRCKAVKAIGWDMPEYSIVQVSMNIVDMDVTPVHEAFVACQQLAEEMGTQVTGSELIGLAPEQVFLAAGQFFLQQKNIGKTRPTLSKKDLLELAVQSLGLAYLAPFDVEERVLEYRLNAPAINLADFLS